MRWLWVLDPLAAPVLPPSSATLVLSWRLQKWSLQHPVASQSLEVQALSESYRIRMSVKDHSPGHPSAYMRISKAGARALKPKFQLHLNCCISFLSLCTFSIGTWADCKPNKSSLSMCHQLNPVCNQWQVLMNPPHCFLPFTFFCVFSLSGLPKK